jgi:hypothetical protein
LRPQQILLFLFVHLVSLVGGSNSGATYCTRPTTKDSTSGGSPELIPNDGSRTRADCASSDGSNIAIIRS